MSREPNTSAFLKLFNSIHPYGNRYDLFRDFVTMAAISLHNAISKNESLEAEYLATIKRYDPKAVEVFPKLLGELVALLEPEPRDVLGHLYMQLEFGNEHVGQFFTPAPISDLMAKLAMGDAIENVLEQKEFITVCEPACGAGGMVLSFAKAVIDAGKNPSTIMWAQCQDVDRTAALMCYVQLTLWNIPGVVIVGNTLAREVREVFYTPAHWLGFWNLKLKRRADEGSHESLSQAMAAPTKIATPLPSPAAPSPSSRNGLESSRLLTEQASFDFNL